MSVFFHETTLPSGNKMIVSGLYILEQLTVMSPVMDCAIRYVVNHCRYRLEKHIGHYRMSKISARRNVLFGSLTGW